MASWNNAQWTYQRVLQGGTGIYYQQDDDGRFSAGVLTLQAKLNLAGYDCGTADGIFGSGTRSAVIIFQQQNNLTVDAKAGRATLLKLDAKVGTADDMRSAIMAEADYWVGKIPYCLDSVISTQKLNRQNPPPYMDCSDFSSSVYYTKMGLKIGTNTSAQITRGVNVEAADMKPGDLILFDWDGDGAPNHVGLCNGSYKMIDETGNNTNPNSFVENENVKKRDLTPTQTSHILKVRRIIQDNGNIVN